MTTATPLTRYGAFDRRASRAARATVRQLHHVRGHDLRFDQHKAGYKASGAARRFGVRLLPDLVEHLNPMRRWEALDLEAALAEAFIAAGVAWVEGGH